MSCFSTGSLNTSHHGTLASVRASAALSAAPAYFGGRFSGGRFVPRPHSAGTACSGCQRQDRGRPGHFCFRLAVLLAGAPLDPHEQQRDEEDRDAGGRQHSGDHRGAHDLAAVGAGAAGEPQRHAAEDEGEGGHEDRPQPQARAFERRVGEALALLVAVLRELDDQDRVLGGEADEHDEADLAEDVERHAARQQAEEGADHRDRHRQQHAEGQRPALVEGREDQEHEADREREHDAAAARGLLLLVGEVAPVVAHLERQHLLPPLPPWRPSPGPEL